MKYTKHRWLYQCVTHTHTHTVCTIRTAAACKECVWKLQQLYQFPSMIKSVGRLQSAAQLSDQLHWYNGFFNPSQLDPQGTGSGCFHTAPICAGGGTTDWQAAVWKQRDKIGYNLNPWRGNMGDAACMGNKVWEHHSLRSFLTSEMIIQECSIQLNRVVGKRVWYGWKVMSLTNIAAVMSLDY